MGEKGFICRVLRSKSLSGMPGFMWMTSCKPFLIIFNCLSKDVLKYCSFNQDWLFHCAVRWEMTRAPTQGEARSVSNMWYSESWIGPCESSPAGFVLVQWLIMFPHWFGLGHVINADFWRLDNRPLHTKVLKEQGGDDFCIDVGASPLGYPQLAKRKN